MGLRWGIGLPGPFYLSGNVFPRFGRRRGRRGGTGLFGLMFLGVFWMIAGCLMLCYWCYLGVIGLVWWGVASLVDKRAVLWPVPARAWTFWRKQSASASRAAAARAAAIRRATPSRTVVTSVRPSVGRPVLASTVQDELLKLQTLHAAGTISAVELEQLKSKLIARA